MKIRARIVASTGACVLAVGTAHGQSTTWDPSISVSGFGTIGYVQTDTDLGLFANVSQHGGVDKDGGFGPDSKLGVQVNARANSFFSATVQAISQRNGDGNFRPSVEWAFVKAQALPELSFRVGRIGAPLFAISDFRNVDYANLRVRPPLDVYGQVIFSHFDGMDAIYQANLGGTTLTGQVFGGVSNAKTDRTRVHFRQEVGLNVTAEFESGVTLRVGHVRGKLTADAADINGLASILESTPFADVGDELSIVRKFASFTGVGVSLDRGNWVGGFEYTQRRTSSSVADTTGWAATAGYRIAKFTPYVVISRLKVDDHNVDNTIPASVPELAPLAAGVDQVIAGQNIGQRTRSAGVRWDAYKNIAVKAQYDRVSPSGGPGQLLETKDGFGKPVSVYSVAVDFVF